MFQTTNIFFNGKVKTDQHKTLKQASRKAWDHLRENNGKEVVITQNKMFVAGITRKHDGVKSIERKDTLTHSFLI